MIDVCDDGHVADILHNDLSNLGAKIAQDDDTAKFIFVGLPMFSREKLVLGDLILNRFGSRFDGIFPLIL